MDHEIVSIDEKLSTLEYELQEIEGEYDQREGEIEDLHEEEEAQLKEAYEAQLRALEHQHALKMDGLHDEMEGKLQPFQDEIIKLKRRRNDIIPASQLPPELLTVIFHAVQTELYRPSFPRWTVVCQVCSLWRTVALGCKKLWCNINVTAQRELMQFLLDRAGDAPLDISIREPPHPDILLKENAQLIISQSHRLGTFDIGAQPSRLDELLLTLDYAAPQLVRLHIYNTGGALWQVRIPPTIFRMHSPKLRAVSITGKCGIYADCRLPQSVTELYLTFDCSNWLGTPTDLCNMLTYLPSLRHLSLQTAVQVTDAPQLYTHRLACLESLVIKDLVASICTILAHISAPSLSSLRLKCMKRRGLYWNHQGRRAHPDELFHCIANFVQCNHPDRMLRSIEVDADEQGLAVAAWNSVAQRPLFTVSLAQLTHEEEAQIFQAIFTNIPSARLEAMIITADPLRPKIMEASWSALLGQLPALATLNLGLRDLQEFLRAVHGSSSVAPLLRTLMLQDADFALPVEGDSVGGLLRRMVSSRRQANIGLQLLHLRKCWSVDAGDVSALREMVETVAWDAGGE